MLTTPEEFAAMTDAQRYDALVRAELQRDNAELLLRQRMAAAAQTQVKFAGGPGESTTQTLAA